MTEQEQAKRLEELAPRLVNLARILRGEAQDFTGLGAMRITIHAVERAFGMKMISPDQYAEYRRLADEDFRRRGGQTSY